MPRHLVAVPRPGHRRPDLTDYEPAGEGPTRGSCLDPDGREGIEKWAAESPATLLMNIQMPETEELEATGEVRRREQGP